MPTVKIDGREITVEPGTRIIEAADRLGIPIPRFCYHPGLSVAANCRMCLVETNKSPKLVPSCYEICQDGLEVKTNSERVRQAQRGVLEFILLHHPVDCPICDQAGECDLQDQYFQYDYQPSRHFFQKHHKPKAKVLGPYVIYDAERCINCTRCVRFCDEVAKAPQLRQVHRGERTYIDVFPGRELDNPYSLCTADVCPVGALTSRDFRFKCRVWFLHGTDSVCAECSRGCSVRVDTFRNAVQRVVPRYNPQVNKWWACDAGRVAYHRFESGRLEAVRPDGGREKALNALADALRQGGTFAVLSPFMTCEDAFAAITVIRLLDPTARFFLGGRPSGFEDDILIRADKNPNRKGLTMVAKGLGVEVAPLSDINPQGLKTLVVFGEENARSEEVVSVSKKANFTALFTSLDGDLAKAASVAFPCTTPYEADGTFVSEFGILQRVRRAVRPGPDCLDPCDWMLELAKIAGVDFRARTRAELFASLAHRCPEFSSLSYDSIGPYGAKVLATSEASATEGS